MFGKRDLEGWQSMEKERRKLDRMMRMEPDERVLSAIAEVRSGVIHGALVPLQQDFLAYLRVAHRIGGVELMGVVFRKSQCDLNDMIDLLYVSNHSGSENVHGGVQYQHFCQALFSVLKSLRGAHLDAAIAGCFTKAVDDTDYFLLQLLTDEKAIKRRLDQYLVMEKLPIDVDLTHLMIAGIKSLAEQDAHLGSDEASMYLQTLLDGGLVVHGAVAYLMQFVRDARILRRAGANFIEQMAEPEMFDRYRGGFSSVGANMVRCLDNQSKVRVINSGNELLYNERLLAMALLPNASKVRDRAVLELMLESGERFVPPGEDNSPRTIARRVMLREHIRETGILGERLYSLGLKKVFENESVGISDDPFLITVK